MLVFVARKTLDKNINVIIDIKRRTMENVV